MLPPPAPCTLAALHPGTAVFSRPAPSMRGAGVWSVGSTPLLASSHKRSSVRGACIADAHSAAAHAHARSASSARTRPAATCNSTARVSPTARMISTSHTVQQPHTCRPTNTRLASPEPNHQTTTPRRPSVCTNAPSCSVVRVAGHAARLCRWQYLLDARSCPAAIRIPVDKPPIGSVASGASPHLYRWGKMSGANSVLILSKRKMAQNCRKTRQGMPAQRELMPRSLASLRAVCT